jgi:hypothetical protein
MVHGDAVAAGRLHGRIQVWLPVQLRELRGYLAANIERSLV